MVRMIDRKCAGWFYRKGSALFLNSDSELLTEIMLTEKVTESRKRISGLKV